MKTHLNIAEKTSASVPTIGQLRHWYDAFVTVKGAAVSKETIIKYRTAIEPYIRHVGEFHWPPTRFGVADYLATVRERASDVTTHVHWSTLRTWFNYIELAGGLGDYPNPAAQLRDMKLAPQLPKPAPKASDDTTTDRPDELPPAETPKTPPPATLPPTPSPEKTAQSIKTAPLSPLQLWKQEVIEMKTYAGCKPKTLRMYELSLQTYINFVGPNHWPPSRTDVMNFLSDIRLRGVSEETVATYWRYLRAFFNYVDVLGGLGDAPNPALQITKLRLAPKLPDLLPKSIPAKHIERFFEYLQSLPPDPLNLRDLALFRFIYTTGCRSGEAAGLSIQDIDLEEQTARFVAKNNKTNTERVVYFNQICQTNLKDWLDYLHQLSDTSRHVFPSMKNNQSCIFPLPRPLTTGAIHHILQRHLSAAGLPHYRVHDLRHTLANRSIHHKSGRFGLGAVQRQLGHKSSAMTLRYSKAHAENQEVFKTFD